MITLFITQLIINSFYIMTVKRVERRQQMENQLQEERTQEIINTINKIVK